MSANAFFMMRLMINLKRVIWMKQGKVKNRSWFFLRYLLK
jgi:hypothetical protein